MSEVNLPNLEQEHIEDTILTSVLEQIEHSINIEIISDEIKDQFGFDSKTKIFNTLLDVDALKYSIRQILVTYKKSIVPEENFSLLTQIQKLEINLEAVTHKYKLLQNELENKFNPNQSITLNIPSKVVPKARRPDTEVPKSPMDKLREMLNTNSDEENVSIDSFMPEDDDTPLTIKDKELDKKICKLDGMIEKLTSQGMDKALEKYQLEHGCVLDSEDVEKKLLFESENGNIEIDYKGMQDIYDEAVFEKSKDD